MAQIKWTKEDVIKKFQEAVTPSLSKSGQRPGVMQTLLDKVKGKIPGKPAEGQGGV